MKNIEKIEKIILKFIEPWSKRNEFEGVLLTGSFMTGFANKYSDIDIHIVMNNDFKYKEKGLKKVDGYLIEYFLNPINEILNYFKEDYYKNRSNAATQFLTGKILIDRNNNIRYLKDQAKKWKKIKFKKIQALDIELIKYKIIDDADNLKGLFITKDKSFEINFYLFLYSIYKDYSLFIGNEIISPSKLLVYLNNPKLSKVLFLKDFKDKIFKKIILKALNSNKNNKIIIINEMVDYVIHKMGGFNRKNWNYKIKLR